MAINNHLRKWRKFGMAVAFSAASVPFTSASALTEETSPNADVSMTDNTDAWSHFMRADLESTHILQTDIPPEIRSRYRRWLAVQADHMSDTYAAKYTDPLGADSDLIRAWHHDLDQLRPLTTLEQIKAVQKYVNDYVTYTLDSDLYEDPAHWATPLETLRNAKGDCEDHAILKYFSLRYLGIKDEDLRLARVDLMRNSIISEEASEQSTHLILLVKHGDDIYNLDNRSNPIIDLNDEDRYQVAFTMNTTKASLYSLLKFDARLADRQAAHEAKKQARNQTDPKLQQAQNNRSNTNVPL